MQEHDSVDDAARGGRMGRRPSVDVRSPPRRHIDDEAAVRQRHPPPPQQQLPAATVTPEAARPWTYLRPPSEEVVTMTCL